MKRAWYRGFHKTNLNPETVISIDNTPVEGRWVYGYYVEAEKLDESGEREYFIMPPSYNESAISVIPATVGRLVHEKDGIEIYEGDIVKCRVSRHGGSSQWYSTKNKYHGNKFTLPFEVVSGPNWPDFFEDSPRLKLTGFGEVMKNQLEQPIGQEKRPQHIDACVNCKDIIDVICTIWDESLEVYNSVFTVSVEELLTMSGGTSE